MEGFEELINEVESLEDTIEILSDENLMEQIRNSEKDIKKGRVSDVNLRMTSGGCSWSDLWTNSVSIDQPNKVQFGNTSTKYF